MQAQPGPRQELLQLFWGGMWGGVALTRPQNQQAVGAARMCGPASILRHTARYLQGHKRKPAFKLATLERWSRRKKVVLGWCLGPRPDIVRCQQNAHLTVPAPWSANKQCAGGSEGGCLLTCTQQIMVVAFFVAHSANQCSEGNGWAIGRDRGAVLC